MSKTTINDDKDIDDWISQVEAARIRNVSKQAIAKLIRRNRLLAREIGGRMLVRRSEVEALVPMQKRAATQKSCVQRASRSEKTEGLSRR